MNKIAPPRRPAAAKNGPPAANSQVSPDPAVEAQARTLDAIFMQLARQVQVDDRASRLPLRQLRVCLALYEGPRSMSELSRELKVSQSAITQIADRLEAAGMVIRAPADEDRRVRSLQLTPRARKMLRLREVARIERAVRIMKRMTPEARDGLLASFAALLAASIEELQGTD